MGHGHHHDHPHPHTHDHEHGPAADSPAMDLSVPDSDLSPSDLTRRGFLRSAGVLGAAATVASLGTAGVIGATPAFAHSDDNHDHGEGGLQWLAGDHHIHTQYSEDGMYRVIDHARHANAYGLDWMVITDHGTVQHAKIGVDKVNPDIVAARSVIKDTLIFQGLEWNIPAAEHGTVFVAPGKNELSVLKEFENTFDGAVTATTGSTPANEALAISGLGWLANVVKQRRVDDAVFFANHPARKGIDSPHEIRAWRDTAPHIALGFEGAPGHQAAGFPKPNGAGSGRGNYEFTPSAASFPAYPLESYRTWGGFDWMTATVGGLWDSLLAEGKAWWITANSDSHTVFADTAVRGPGTDFATNGFHNDPVYGQSAALTQGDFWPGYYSKTHVGAKGFSYLAVMDGLRAGRVWVSHGGLISSLDVSVSARNESVTLGGVLSPRRGSAVSLEINIDLATTPNWAQFIPKLARVDLIVGDVTGPAADKDIFNAPKTKVVKSFEVNKSTGKVTLKFDLGRADQPYYLRLRGTDGNRGAVGFNGPAVDPSGPAMDVLGDADPWKDLWFYSNPIWVLPSR
jgi:hypothetical protein